MDGIGLHEGDIPELILYTRTEILKAIRARKEASVAIAIQE